MTAAALEVTARNGSIVSPGERLVARTRRCRGSSGRYGSDTLSSDDEQPARAGLGGRLAGHDRGQGEEREPERPADVGHRVVAVGALGGHVGERAVGDREAHHAGRDHGQRAAEAVDPPREHGQHDRHGDDVRRGVDHREHALERVALARHVDDAEEGAVARRTRS